MPGGHAHSEPPCVSMHSMPGGHSMPPPSQLNAHADPMTSGKQTGVSLMPNAAHPSSRVQGSPHTVASTLPSCCITSMQISLREQSASPPGHAPKGSPGEAPVSVVEGMSSLVAVVSSEAPVVLLVSVPRAVSSTIPSSDDEPEEVPASEIAVDPASSLATDVLVPSLPASGNCGAEAAHASSAAPSTPPRIRADTMGRTDRR